MEYESGFAHDETTDKIIELTLRIRFSLIILAKRGCVKIDTSSFLLPFSLSTA